jgi:hypothetical protein
MQAMLRNKLNTLLQYDIVFLNREKQKQEASKEKHYYLSNITKQSKQNSYTSLQIIFLKYIIFQKGR